MKRLHLLLWSVLVLVAACGPLPTATQPVLIVTATPPSTTTTPTREVGTSIAPTAAPACPASGSHKCFLFEPINPNFGLDEGSWLWPPSRSAFPVPGSGEVIKHTVQAPNPRQGNVVYDWSFEMVGQDGTRRIPGWIPDVFYKRDHFTLNVSSASGTALLTVELVQLEAGQNYVADLEYLPRVRLIDDRTPYADSAAQWRGLCTIITDSGTRYGFDVQGLSADRAGWSAELTEHVTVSFKAERDVGIVLSCGLDLGAPIWTGDVQILSYRIEPVDWPDGDMQRVLR